MDYTIPRMPRLQQQPEKVSSTDYTIPRMPRLEQQHQHQRNQRRPWSILFPTPPPPPQPTAARPP